MSQPETPSTPRIPLSKPLVVFEINPIPAIRTTTNQWKMMRIPRHKLGVKEKQLVDKLERYAKYKENLKMLAIVYKFQMPPSDVHVVFHLETNDSLLWGHPHRERTPDWDNLIKAVQDAICSNDHHIWDVRVSKFWTEPKKGRTEIYAL